MRFWDSSALVPLLVQQTQTQAVTELYQQDPQQAVWWASDIECASALARLDRENRFSSLGAVEAAFTRLDALRRHWHEVQPIAEIRQVARRLLRVHSLRAADALQLAAAFVTSERRPPTLEVVSLDQRVSTAALLEGFLCLP